MTHIDQAHPHAVPGHHPTVLPGMDSLRMLSISHKTAPLDELERMALPAAAAETLYRTLRARHIEAVLISTCNRTELYWSSHGPQQDAEVEALLMAAAGPGNAPDRRHFVAMEDGAAAEHLFRVAAGLESLVVGEAEILGQVRSAIDGADQFETSGFFVSGLFRAALRFGGKARQETGIGTGALSVASASVQLLTRVHPDLEQSTVLVIGAGATGLKAARHLKAERVGRIVILNRTPQRAEEAARELGCDWAPLDQLPALVPLADAIVAAAQVEAPIVTAEMLHAAMPKHPSRSLVLLDLSLPRAIDPACASVSGTVHHDLSGLEQIVAHNRARREREVPRVEVLLGRELEVFQDQVRESRVRPVLSELRQMAEAIRRAEIERAAADGPIDEAALDRLTRRIVDRLLHGPSMVLKRGDLGLDGQHTHYLRMMFGLSDGAGPSPHGPHGPHGPMGPHGPHGPQGEAHEAR